MHPMAFEPTITAGERPHAYTLDREATGTGGILSRNLKKNFQK